FIYSSPGSTGATDPVGGLVWQNSSANSPLPLAGDATCAQPRFDPVNRNLYYACNEGNHVRMTIGHVASGQRTGIVYHNIGQPDSFPSWFNDPSGSTAYKWWGYVGVITGATTSRATIAQQRFTEKPMYYGQICNQGIGCSVSGGDRTMADFFGFASDRSGGMRIVYNDTTSQHHGAHLYEIRQLGGRSIFG